MGQKTRYCYQIFPKFIYRFNTIQIKVTEPFFVEIDKLILKFKWKYKSHKVATQL